MAKDKLDWTFVENPYKKRNCVVYSITVLIGEIELGSMVDEQRHHFFVASFTSHEDRRALIGLTANVSVGAVLQQKAQHVHVPVCYGAVQSRYTLPILCISTEYDIPLTTVLKI